jgi:hypothetical protein
MITDVSEERFVPFFRVETVSQACKTYAAKKVQHALMSLEKEFSYPSP